LLPEDNPAEFETEPHPWIAGAVMLAHQPDGRCIYLAADHCTIHERRPQLCRALDCRRVAAVMTGATARQLDQTGHLSLRVWKRGRELLRAWKRDDPSSRD
jgi:hypothetical protein